MLLACCTTTWRRHVRRLAAATSHGACHATAERRRPRRDGEESRLPPLVGEGPPPPELSREGGPRYRCGGGRPCGRRRSRPRMCRRRRRPYTPPIWILEEEHNGEVASIRPHAPIRISHREIQPRFTTTAPDAPPAAADGRLLAPWWPPVLAHVAGEESRVRGRQRVTACQGSRGADAYPSLVASTALGLIFFTGKKGSRGIEPWSRVRAHGAAGGGRARDRGRCRYIESCPLDLVE